MEKLIDEKQVEQFYGINRSSLQKWRCLGGGPRFIKIGRRVRYRASDIEECIDAHVKLSTSNYDNEVSKK